MGALYSVLCTQVYEYTGACVEVAYGNGNGECESRLLKDHASEAVNSHNASLSAGSWDDPIYCELACCLQFFTVHEFEYL